MRERLRNALPAIASLVVFLVALVVLRRELHAVSWHQVTHQLWNLPGHRLAIALGLTALNYLVLTGYDLLAFRYIEKRLPAARIAVTSFLAYAVSNNVGFAMLSGASIRYRFYSRWGVTAEELSRIVFSYSVTFWLGLIALGGISAITTRVPGAVHPAWGPTLPIVGWVFVLGVVAFLAATVVRREPVRVYRFVLPLPRPTLALQQLAISALDWSLAGAVLYVLLPPTALPFLGFLGAFFVAIVIGMVSHVPGGVGVFEGLMVLLLKPYLPSGQVLPALVAYRLIYYLLPLTVALVGLIADELRQRREGLARAGSWLGRAADFLTPRLLGAFVFMAGVVLLLSGATPAARGRLNLIGQILPLGVVEVSHFVGSLTGAALLLLSQGLARRLDAAYYVTALLIVVGMATSLLKGFDYEEALLLLGVLVALRRSRAEFDRRAALFETRFSPGWFAAVIGALGASVWLGFFAFKHVDYAHDLWWQFELHGEASRFLRASVGAALVILIVALARLLAPAAHEADEPTDQDLADAERVLAEHPTTAANLVFLRDKATLFSPDRRGFVMYGVQGRTWLAMGDPVGPRDLVAELVRLFLERCDDFAGVPAFYEVCPEYLHYYADFGLTFLKLGEEAIVHLPAFTFDGGDGRKLRQSLRRIEKERACVRMIPPGEAGPLMGELRAVSDDWLDLKATAEKGFSLGFFDESYLRRGPIAVIEREGRVLAFANVWTSGVEKQELSIDLMRYRRDAPKGIMESLMVYLISWGKEQGYQRFVLGMAPLSGFETSPIAPFWYRVGRLLYRHGEPVYNFQGLRAYKDKFKPEWEPRYLAYPGGGLSLPRVLADSAALIAGGYRRILMK